MKIRAVCFKNCLIKSNPNYDKGRNSLCLKCIKGQIERKEKENQLALFEVPDSYFNGISNL